ncbi:MAG: hypothetical protein ABIH90_00890 [Candidatus Aenigmatarchaeota archaeon]
MVDQKLLDSLKAKLEKGKTQEEAKELLSGEGWDEEHIDEALNAIGSTEEPDDFPEEEKIEEPKAEDFPDEKPTAKGFPEDEPRESSKEKPTGQRPVMLSIISIIGILFSILGLLGGITLLGLSGLDMLGGLTGDAGNPLLELLGFSGVVTGTIMSLVNIAALVGFYMLFRMNRLGWALAMAMGVISVILGLLSLVQSFAIFGLTFPLTLAWLVIVAYLFLERELFSKPAQAEAPQQ